MANDDDDHVDVEMANRTVEPTRELRRGVGGSSLNWLRNHVQIFPARLLASLSRSRRRVGARMLQFLARSS